MNCRTLLIAIAAVMAGGGLLLIGCSKQPEPGDGVGTAATSKPPAVPGYRSDQAERRIVIHCGTSMRPAAERLADAFQEQHGIPVQFNFGGSSELLATLELSTLGDIYICHDPYADRIAEKGLLRRAETVGYLEPVIMVQPGNPNNITGLADLARPGLRLAMPDSRVSTAGRLVEQVLTELGIAPDIRRNIRMEARGHNDIALALAAGQVDAAVIWNFIATYYQDRLEAVPPGVQFPETKVTLCLLKHAQDVEAAELFIQMAQSPQGREIFKSLGYRRSVPPENAADE
jgi:molybdate transport system substrate-binding protein